MRKVYCIQSEIELGSLRVRRRFRERDVGLNRQCHY